MKQKKKAYRIKSLTVLYFEQAEITDADMIWGFLESGYEDVRVAELRVPDAEYTEEDLSAVLAEILRTEEDIMPGGPQAPHADRKGELLVITRDFSAVVAEACHRTAHTYLSWVHDAPQRGLYLKEALYDTNRVFVFDKMQLARMRARGIPHVFYQPLATNITRVSMPEMMAKDLSPYRADISFVGNLYENPARDAFFAKLAPEAKKECDDLLDRVIGHRGEGGSVYETLSRETYDGMLAHFSTEHKELYAEEDWEYLMVTATLAQECAHRERIRALTALAALAAPEGDQSIRLYTTYPEEAKKMLPASLDIRGAVSYEEEMPLVFRASKINLHLTPPSIESGVSLRVFDILGAGGFALTDAQPEIRELFTDGKELVTFSSFDEMMEKAAYYLSHDDERKRIAQAGHRRVRECYTCPQAVRHMMKEAGI